MKNTPYHIVLPPPVCFVFVYIRIWQLQQALNFFSKTSICNYLHIIPVSLFLFFGLYIMRIEAASTGLKIPALILLTYQLARTGCVIRSSGGSYGVVKSENNLNCFYPASKLAGLLPNGCVLRARCACVSMATTPCLSLSYDWEVVGILITP